MGVAFVAFDQNQINRGHPGQNFGQLRLGPTVFSHQGKAVRRCKHHFGCPGRTVPKAVFAGVVQIDIVMHMLDR